MCSRKIDLKLYLFLPDDGKIFIGSGVGDPFGPPCQKGIVYSSIT